MSFLPWQTTKYENMSQENTTLKYRSTQKLSFTSQYKVPTTTNRSSVSRTSQKRENSGRTTKSRTITPTASTCRLGHVGRRKAKRLRRKQNLRLLFRRSRSSRPKFPSLQLPRRRNQVCRAWGQSKGCCFSSPARTQASLRTSDKVMSSQH